MAAVMNPLMVGMINPINNDIKKQNPVFGMNELSFVPTLNATATTQQPILSNNRPTTLFGHTAQAKSLPNAPVVQPQLGVQPMYDAVHYQQLQQQQQMQIQQQQQQQMRQQQQLLMQQQQASSPIPTQAQMQVQNMQQQGPISHAVNKNDVMEEFNNSIVISLETYTSSNIQHVQARGLSSEEVSEIAKEVARIKRESNNKKRIQIFLFGLMGYMMWRNGAMGRRLYLRLDPIIEETNEKLAMRSINVRFAWTAGELRAYF